MMLSLSSLKVKNSCISSTRLSSASCSPVGTLGGAARSQSLHADANFINILDIARIQAHHAHAARSAHHQAFLLQAAQRFADGRAADAEFFA